MKPLKQIRNHNTRILFHLSYWNVPLDGIMLWKGKLAYFYNVCDDLVVKGNKWDQMDIDEWKKTCNENNWIFREETLYDWYYYSPYKVCDIPKKIMDNILKDHYLFRKYVGKHTDYNLEGMRGIGAKSKSDLGDLKSYNLHSKYYNRYKFLGKFNYLYKKLTGKLVSQIKLHKCSVIGDFYLVGQS